MKMCKSGRPLRREFDGVFFFPTDKLRIIELPTKRDVIRPYEEAIALLKGKQKQAGVEAALMVNGYYEAGNYRIELWKEGE